jgi:hypothetical protein
MASFDFQNELLLVFCMLTLSLKIRFLSLFKAPFGAKKFVYSPKIKYAFDDGVLHKFVYEGDLFSLRSFQFPIC